MVLYPISKNRLLINSIRKEYMDESLIKNMEEYAHIKWA